MALRRRGPKGQERSHALFAGFTDVVEIGVGSLATVFCAHEIDTQRLVALKLLNIRDVSPRAIESFERESIALGALSSHPNIVTLFRSFRTPDGRPVLVLELCTASIAERLHGGAGLPVVNAVAIGIKVAGALETAHRAGILHRDVKPQNILVTDFGEPALADFGVAMLQSATQTTAGLFDFTTLHAAPELLEGGGTSAATDVYELASTLYQLIAGHSAFRAYEGESPASVILRILRDPVRPLSGTGVPAELSDLLVRAMAKEQNERPPTSAEFAAGLAGVEISQGWPRTQFLIRDAVPSLPGLAPRITRLPDAAQAPVVPAPVVGRQGVSHVMMTRPRESARPPAGVPQNVNRWSALAAGQLAPGWSAQGLPAPQWPAPARPSADRPGAQHPAATEPAPPPSERPWNDPGPAPSEHALRHAVEAPRAAGAAVESGWGAAALNSQRDSEPEPAVASASASAPVVEVGPSGAVDAGDGQVDPSPPVEPDWSPIVLVERRPTPEVSGPEVSGPQPEPELETVVSEPDAAL